MTGLLPLGAVVLAAAAAGCVEPADEMTGVRLYAMATSIEVIVPGVATDRFDALTDDIESFLRRFERDYYAWGDGELAALNAALAHGETYDATTEMADLLLTSRQLAAASLGTFEPALAPLVELWGFHDAAAASPAPPPRTEVAKRVETMGSIADLRLDGTVVSAPGGRIMLDLGGIAKGRAVDSVIAYLAGRGVTDALVNAGGDIRVLGQAAGRPWRVGIQSPRAPEPFATLELRGGEAAFTSGDYERFVAADGARIHHLLDPRTGFPAVHTQAVTVIAGDGTAADAAATAIFVAGPGRWLEVAASMGITEVLRIDASGRIEATAALRDRLQTSGADISNIVVSEL